MASPPSHLLPVMRRSGDLRYARTAALVFVAALMLLLAACGNPLASLTQKTVAQDGGVIYTLTAQCPTTASQCSPAAMRGEITVLQYRCQHGLGVSDVAISQQGANSIIVQLPAFSDSASAQSLLTKPGVLDFIDTDGQQLAVGATPTPGQYPILFTNSDLDPSMVQAQIDSQTNQPVVTFEFRGSAQAQFATYTRDHVGQFLTVTLDGVVIESATIQSEIDGQGQIFGIGSMAAAQNLAVELQTRPLPLPVTLVSVRQVKAP